MNLYELSVFSARYILLKSWVTQSWGIIHIVIRMCPDSYFTDKEIIKRYQTYYGEDSRVSRKKMKALRDKWSSLSEYMKDVKQTFSRYYKMFVIINFKRFKHLFQCRHDKKPKEIKGLEGMYNLDDGRYYRQN